MIRLAVFVDGSNLVGDLRRMQIQVDDYEAFFLYLVEQAIEAWGGCTFASPAIPVQLIRVNWYALGHIDEWNLEDDKAQASLHESFEKNREVKAQYLAKVGPTLPAATPAEKSEAAWKLCFEDGKRWYEERSKLIDGFKRFYHSVRSRTDFIDIIECGHWRVDLLERSVSEKNLDTRLAVDMVTMKDGYDLAILLSGDADNIPSVHYLKSCGKQVGVVEFLAGYPPEKSSKHSSSRLKVAADFVVQLYEMNLLAKNLARRPPDQSANSH